MQDETNHNLTSEHFDKLYNNLYCPSFGAVIPLLLFSSAALSGNKLCYRPSLISYTHRQCQSPACMVQQAAGLRATVL